MASPTQNPTLPQPGKYSSPRAQGLGFLADLPAPLVIFCTFVGYLAGEDLAAAYASGDDDPYDDTETGYDAIFENPVFAGADTSYWIRQSIPFAGGGRAISVNGRGGMPWFTDILSPAQIAFSRLSKPSSAATRSARAMRRVASIAADAASAALLKVLTVNSSRSVISQKALISALT